MKQAFFGLLCALCLTGCRTQEISGYYQIQLRWMMYSTNYVSSTGYNLNYRVAVPKTYTKVPLVVYLHGQDGSGIDNVSQLRERDVGCIMKYMREEKEEAILLAPQCLPGVNWQGESLRAVYELIQKYNESELVDTNRVYLTGYDIGGQGAWKLALRHPETFTAVAPVVGDPPVSATWSLPELDRSLTWLNIWAVQYCDDYSTNQGYTKKIMSDLWAKDSMSAHVLVDLTGGHTCKIYRKREFLDRIFGSRKLSALYQ